MTLLIAITEAVQDELGGNGKLCLKRETRGETGLVLMRNNLVQDVADLGVELVLGLGREDGINIDLVVVVLKGARARGRLAGIHDLVVQLVLEVGVELVTVFRVLVTRMAANLRVHLLGSVPVQVGVRIISNNASGEEQGGSQSEGGLGEHFDVV